jgi:hypothetical protein
VVKLLCSARLKTKGLFCAFFPQLLFTFEISVFVFGKYCHEGNDSTDFFYGEHVYGIPANR